MNTIIFNVELKQKQLVDGNRFQIYTRLVKDGRSQQGT